MRPITLTLIAILGLPAITMGQTVAGRAIGSTVQAADPTPNWFIRPLIGPPSAGYPPRDPPPSFAIPPLLGPPSVGLPPIGTRLSPIGLRPDVGSKRHGPHHPQRPVVFWPIFVMPHVAWSMTAPPYPEPAPVKKESTAGSLLLEVEPGSAQIFIDGYYVGTPDDFGGKGGGVVLEGGPHRVDINAPGYELVSFDVRISPNQSIVYRRVLKLQEVAPAPAPQAFTTPKTVYVIPGCYLGDVPPKDAKLPSTCDITRAVTLSAQ
jgi:hypothetical protein